MALRFFHELRVEVTKRVDLLLEIVRLVGVGDEFGGDILSRHAAHRCSLLASFSAA
jgi:hypothetical protein